MNHLVFTHNTFIITYLLNSTLGSQTHNIASTHNSNIHLSETDTVDSPRPTTINLMDAVMSDYMYNWDAVMIGECISKRQLINFWAWLARVSACARNHVVIMHYLRKEIIINKCEES